MAENLREQLIGAWKLVSYQEIPVDGSDPFEPLGHQPRGLIIYTPDGYMSAQLSKADRPDFGSADWFAGTADDYAAEATSYIAYSGPFHVDEEKQPLTHSMFVSLFPNWTGQTQPRRVKLEDDRLHLGTASNSVERKDGQFGAHLAPSRTQLITHRLPRNQGPASRNTPVSFAVPCGPAPLASSAVAPKRCISVVNPRRLPQRKDRHEQRTTRRRHSGCRYRTCDCQGVRGHR